MSKSTFGLPKKREQVINLLQQAYIEQNLEEDDYEQRLTKAMAADSLETLQEVIADFPNAPKTAACRVAGKIRRLDRFAARRRGRCASSSDRTALARCRPPPRRPVLLDAQRRNDDRRPLQS